MGQRWTKWAWALVVVAASVPSALGLGPVTPSGQATHVAADGEMDRLLAAWESHAAGRKSLSIVFDRVDKSAKWGDQVYQGQAVLKSPDLACLEFKKAVPGPDGKPQYVKDAKGNSQLKVESEPFERIVCTGKEVLWYEWDVRQVFVFPLAKDARQRSPFRFFFLDSSLPFLFNMKAAEARQRYDLKILKQDERAYTIEFKPREQIDKQSFRAGYVILSKTSFLPDQVVLLPVGDKGRQDFNYRVIRPNEEIPDGYFRLSADLPGWKVVRFSGETTLPGFGWWARFLELNRAAPTPPPTPDPGESR